MSWIQFLLPLFILLSLPLSQMDQTDINWLVCENSLIIKSEMKGPSIDQNLWLDSKLPSSFLNQIESFSQMKNLFSALPSHFQDSPPFWRPPPGFKL